MTFSPKLGLPVSIKNPELKQFSAALHEILRQYTTGINTPPTVQTFVGVPATHAATGTPGQWSADANFLYVCYATNSWARIAWTSTTF